MRTTGLKPGDRVRAVATQAAIDDGLLEAGWYWVMVVVGHFATDEGIWYMVAVKERAPEQAFSFDADGVSESGMQYALERKMGPTSRRRIRPLRTIHHPQQETFPPREAAC